VGGYLSLPVLALAVVIQATVMPELRIAGGAPDLVLLLVLGYSLLYGFERGVVWAIVGGILHDLLSAVPEGVTALALVVTIGAAALVVGRNAPRNLLIPPLVAAGATVLYHIATLLILLVAGRPLPIPDLLLYVTVPTAIYNLLLMAPLYYLLGMFSPSRRPRRLEDRQQRL